MLDRAGYSTSTRTLSGHRGRRGTRFHRGLVRVRRSSPQCPQQAQSMPLGITELCGKKGNHCNHSSDSPSPQQSCTRIPLYLFCFNLAPSFSWPGMMTAKPILQLCGEIRNRHLGGLISKYCARKSLLSLSDWTRLGTKRFTLFLEF